MRKNNTYENRLAHREETKGVWERQNWRHRFGARAAAPLFKRQTYGSASRALHPFGSVIRRWIIRDAATLYKNEILNLEIIPARYSRRQTTAAFQIRDLRISRPGIFLKSETRGYWLIFLFNRSHRSRLAGEYGYRNRTLRLKCTVDVDEISDRRIWFGAFSNIH